MLKFLFVRRIRLLIFFSNGCGAKDVFWGELGWGCWGNCLRCSAGVAWRPPRRTP